LRATETAGNVSSVQYHENSDFHNFKLLPARTQQKQNFHDNNDDGEPTTTFVLVDNATVSITQQSTFGVFESFGPARTNAPCVVAGGRNRK
jgi:hypothetical protein